MGFFLMEISLANLVNSLDSFWNGNVEAFINSWSLSQLRVNTYCVALACLSAMGLYAPQNSAVDMG